MKFLDSVRVSSLLLAIERERMSLASKIFLLQLSLSLLYLRIISRSAILLVLAFTMPLKNRNTPYLLPVETSTYLGMRICKISRCLKIKHQHTMDQLSESLAGTPFFWIFVLFLLIFLQILN